MQDLTVELWSTPAHWRQGFINDTEVLTARAAARPRRLRAARADGQTLVLGRYAGDDLGEDHLAWTDPDPAREDTALSRSQVRLLRQDATWRVAVPGPARSRRRVHLRYWASGRVQVLEAGNPSAALDPGAHACLSVTTPSACYWALVSTPAEVPGAFGGLASGGAATAGGVATASGVLTDGGVDGEAGRQVDPDRLAGFPIRWRWAMEIKFRPFLTWPMDLAPALVEPRHYRDPVTGESLTGSTSQNRIRHLLLDTQEAAVRHGYEPREPHALDTGLLDWLRTRDLMRFDTHRVPWLDPKVES